MKQKLKIFGFLVALFAAFPQAHAASAVALVETTDGATRYGWADHSRTLDDAKAEAIRRCVDSAREVGAAPEGCHVAISRAAPGYWTIYNAKDGKISVGVSPTSQQDATNRAWNTCEGQCEDPANHIWYDDGSGRVPANSGRSRYTTHCQGNECERHYSSGKVVRFTTCINPSTGQPFDNLDGSCSGFDMSGHALNQ